MEIQKMTIDDYEAIFDLWVDTPNMGLRSLDDSKEGIDLFLKRNPDTCIVVLDSEMVTGVILCGHDGRRGYIYHTVVHPNFRKQGIGSALVKAVLNALERLGICKVALVVFEKNADGNAFWENQGFMVRNDLTYRNKTLVEMVRIDT